MPFTPILVRLLSVFVVTFFAAGCVSVTPAPSAEASSSVQPTPREPDASRSVLTAPRLETSVTLPGRIEATGALDVSASLQAYIDRVPDGSEIVFPPGAVYRLSSGILLRDRRDLSLVGEGVTLRVSGCDHANSGIFVIESQRISIRGFAIEGDNADGGTAAAYHEGCEYAAGINIHGGQHIGISDVTITDMMGDCLYVDGTDNTNVWSSTIRMVDSACARNGRMGVALTAATDVRVERVSLESIALHAFVIEPWRAGGGATEVLFADNTVTGYGLSDHLDPNFRFFYGGVGLEDSTIQDVVVARNQVVGSSLRSYAVDPPQQRLWLLDNTSDQPAKGPVMTMHHLDGLTIAGNTQPLISGGLAEIRESTDVVYLP